MTSSLIIITLNRAALLERTLEGLARQTRQIDEIIVVDNGPTRDTEQVVSASAARYVAEPRRGYGHARNCGLAEARGAVIYFLDDDCVPEPDWSDVLWNVLDSGEADLASGSRAPGQPGLAARLEYLSTDGPVLSPGLAAGPARHLSTSNLILRREVIEKVGCFDTTLTMCEDRDFTTRARKLGFRLRYEPKARVTHYPAIHGLSDYLGKMRHYEPERRNIFAVGARKNPWRACSPLVPRCACFCCPRFPRLVLPIWWLAICRNAPMRCR